MTKFLAWAILVSLTLPAWADSHGKGKHANKFVPKPPGSAAAETARGYGWMLSGKCDEAIVSYRNALRLDPKMADAKLGLARCLSRRNARPEERSEARVILKALAETPGPLAANRTRPARSRGTTASKNAEKPKVHPISNYLNNLACLI